DGPEAVAVALVLLVEAERAARTRRVGAGLARAAAQADRETVRHVVVVEAVVVPAQLGEQPGRAAPPAPVVEQRRRDLVLAQVAVLAHPGVAEVVLEPRHGGLGDAAVEPGGDRR